MVGPLVERLESLSGYRHVYPPHDPNAGRNPVVYSHFRVDLGGRTASILSRVCDSGLDHTDRTNKYAHHVVLDESELPAGGPAWLLGRPGFMSTSWSGEPRILDVGRPAPRGDRAPGLCSHWGDVTGDAGWGGVVAESLLETPKRPIFLVYEPGVELLPLLAEALALLPPSRRWHVNFSTYFTKLPADLVCTVRGVLRDSPEARHARRVLDALIVDLSAAPAPPAGGPLVHQARTGEAPAVSTPQPPAPRDPSPGFTPAGRATPPPSHKPRPHSAPPEAPLYGVAPPPPPASSTRPEPAYSPRSTPSKRRLAGPLIIAATTLNLALLAGNVYLWTARPRPEPTPPPPSPPVAKRDAVAVIAPPEPAVAVDSPESTTVAKPPRKAAGKKTTRDAARTPNKPPARPDGDNPQKTDDHAKDPPSDAEGKEIPAKDVAEAPVTKDATAATPIVTGPKQGEKAKAAVESEVIDGDDKGQTGPNAAPDTAPDRTAEKSQKLEIKYVINPLPDPKSSGEVRIANLSPKPAGVAPKLELRGVVDSTDIDPGERWSLTPTWGRWPAGFRTKDPYGTGLKSRKVAQFSVRNSGLYIQWIGEAANESMQPACDSLRDCLLTVSWTDGSRECYLLRTMHTEKAFDVEADLRRHKFANESSKFRIGWKPYEKAPSTAVKLQDVRLQMAGAGPKPDKIPLKPVPNSPKFEHTFETPNPNVKATVSPANPDREDARAGVLVTFNPPPNVVNQKITALVNEMRTLSQISNGMTSQPDEIQKALQRSQELTGELDALKKVEVCYYFRLSFRLTIEVDGQTVEVARVGQ